MMDMDCNSKKMVCTSPKLTRSKSNSGNSIKSPVRLGESPMSSSSSSACAAYEQYLRLPELAKLWSRKDFPDWSNESLLKPALQALEITFRFVSIVLSDPRPYVNRREWKLRLESLTTHQIELIAALCEDESKDGTAPIVDLSTSNGVLARTGSSSAEVWKLPGAATPPHMVSRASEASLLPRLATWQKSEDVASKIMFSIECEMQRCPYTLGVGEPNLSGKPNLDYDLVCKPSDLHSLKRIKNLDNYENHTLFTTHQILESWIFVSHQLLSRISDGIDGNDFDNAASDCWLLERIWKLLSEIEDLHLLMDPNDFLRLKNQLAIKAFSSTEAFCFRSSRLMEVAKLSKDLKHKVPTVLGVEVDPKGGPRIQEAAMQLYRGHKNNGEVRKIHLLQGFQAVESAIKKFFFSYRQLIVTVMGSLEANGNRAVVSVESDDSLTRVFSEPTYFPSLDAAKTFLGDFWSHDGSNGIGSEGKNRVKK